MHPKRLPFFKSVVLALIFLTHSALRLCAQQQTPANKTQAETNVNTAFVGVNLQRTRVYNSALISLPTTVIWKTDTLFEADPFFGPVTVDGLSGRDTEGPKRPYFTELLVAGDVLYFSTYTKDSDLVAVDAKTGIDRWRFKIKAATVSPPGIAAGSAFVGSSDGWMYCVDIATGLERWKFKLHAHVVTPSAPLVDSGLVYFTSSEGTGAYATRYEGRIYALDAQTGEQKWVFKSNASLSSPAISNKTLYVGDGEAHLHAIDGATGQEKWILKVKKAVASPAVMNDTVYFVDYDGALYAVDVRSGQEKWKTAKNTSGTILALADTLVYYGGWENGVYAVDAASGARKWDYKTIKHCRPPIVAGGVVYTSCYDGFIHAVDAATGAEKWKLEGKGTVPSSPVIADGVLYFLNAGRMYAVR